jgi:hypothetical protein
MMVALLGSAQMCCPDDVLLHAWRCCQRCCDGR